MDGTHTRTGTMIVLSGPSGAGKTTVYRELLAARPETRFSVSCTTRRPRNGELDGRDYHFVSPAEFERKVQEGDFLEHAEVHGNHYGTLKRDVLEQVQQARDVLLDIDVQGARQVRQAVHGTGLESVALFVFCGPPSFAELERRLRARASDPEEVIQRRLRNARTELQAWREYEYVVINRTVPEAVRDLAAVVDAFRCRASRFDPEIWNDD